MFPESIDMNMTYAEARDTLVTQLLQDAAAHEAGQYDAVGRRFDAVEHRFPTGTAPELEDCTSREIDLAESIDLAAEYGLYAYDAYLLACAKNQRAPLLTLDRALMKAAKSAGVKVLEVAI